MARRPPWDSRVTYASAGNDRRYTSYRVYFVNEGPLTSSYEYKDVAKKRQRLLMDKLSAHRDPMFRSPKLESGWDNRAPISVSLHNHELHNAQREFFDAPRRMYSDGSHEPRFVVDEFGQRHYTLNYGQTAQKGVNATRVNSPGKQAKGHGHSQSQSQTQPPSARRLPPLGALTMAQSAAAAYPSEALSERHALGSGSGSGAGTGGPILAPLPAATVPAASAAPLQPVPLTKPKPVVEPIRQMKTKPAASAEDAKQPEPVPAPAPAPASPKTKSTAAPASPKAKIASPKATKAPAPASPKAAAPASPKPAKAASPKAAAAPVAAAVPAAGAFDIAGWVFYPGLESNGGEHKEQCPNHNKNRAVLAAHCEKVGAIAFNTNGWVKSTICAVPFQQFPGAAPGDGQGLYVRASHAPYTPSDIPGWVFFAGADNNGNDHKEQAPNHGKNKAVLAAHCDKVGAVAFNTNGWCKTKLRGGALDAFPNTGAGEGLYVRVQHAPYLPNAAYDIPGWAFFQGKDSSGNDHTSQPQNHGKNARVIAAHAEQVGAVCFNTNGWVKTKCTDLPLHDFPNAAPGQGLYVKLSQLPKFAQ